MFVGENEGTGSARGMNGCCGMPGGIDVSGGSADISGGLGSGEASSTPGCTGGAEPECGI